MITAHEYCTSCACNKSSLHTHPSTGVVRECQSHCQFKFFWWDKIQLQVFTTSLCVDRQTAENAINKYVTRLLRPCDQESKGTDEKVQPPPTSLLSMMASRSFVRTHEGSLDIKQTAKYSFRLCPSPGQIECRLLLHHEAHANRISSVWTSPAHSFISFQECSTPCPPRDKVTN